jgi:hypothetical protein
MTDTVRTALSSFLTRDWLYNTATEVSLRGCEQLQSPRARLATCDRFDAAPIPAAAERSNEIDTGVRQSVQIESLQLGLQ